MSEERRPHYPIEADLPLDDPQIGAREYSRRAYVHALNASHEVRQLGREVDHKIQSLHADVQHGFERLGVRIRRVASKQDASDEEITAVRDMRLTLRRWRRATWTVALAAAGIAIGTLCAAFALHWLHWGP